MIFILDVDGVMTTGQFIYSEAGKVYKVFGPHDSDGLKMLKGKFDILFITADKRGYGISEKRIVDDMGYELRLVSEEDRFDYVGNRWDWEYVIYMGDGYCDERILKACRFGIAPANARKEAKRAADFITNSKAGEGAVMDACLEILREFPS